jgi:hypothetical protein
MKLKVVSVWSALALLAATTACEKKSPTAPSTPQTASSQTASVTDAATGITLTSPAPLTPADGQQIKFTDQPIKLIVNKAFSTGSRALTYTFEVSSDAGFGTIASSRSGVAADGSGQVSATMDKLAGATTYYWRVRASSGSFTGLNSKARTFVVGPEVVLQAPALLVPGDGGNLGNNGLLTVADAPRSGPAGAIVYRFEVSDSPNFANLVFFASANEQHGVGQTSVTMTADLVSNVTYYWRVQATDPANQVSGPYSAVASFKYVPFDWRQVTMVSSPFDFATWAETARVTSVIFTPDAFLVDFDKRDGPNRWPDVPFGSGSLEYTLGMCLNISNHWYCSAVVQFWFGRELSASGIPGNVSFEWFYDPARWRQMTGYQPQEGETVGLFACAGNCRNNDAGDRSYVKERTNIALVPWSNSGNGNYSFSAGRAIRH